MNVVFLGGADFDSALADYCLVPATCADRLRRLGRADEDRAAYECGLEVAPTGAERR